VLLEEGEEDEVEGHGSTSPYCPEGWPSHGGLERATALLYPQRLSWGM